jgi:putative transposase
MTEHERAGERAADRRADRARDIALFRYALIRSAADPALTTRQRGQLVRALAEAEHPGPFGQPVRISRVTIDRWIRAWRAGGFDALLPSARHAEPRTDSAVLELAAALKREAPERTAAQVAAILTAHAGTAPSPRTLQRHFARRELTTRPSRSGPRSFGRFEAAVSNERWTGDALHGPVVAGRKTYLFAFLDDHSRAIVGHRWGHSEDTVRLEAALRAGLAARGLPQVVYVDNGSAFVSAQLLRALASLGIKLTHSKPGQPAGRGKIERFFRTVREQFLVELGVPGVARAIDSLAQLNELFTAWVETVYHAREHSETGQAPLARFLAGLPDGPPLLPSPAALHEAFLWSARRTVTKTATISLHGNSYQVDAALVGRRIEVVFDPFDLTRLDVRYQGRPMGTAVPHRIGRHVHPDAHPDRADPPPAATGIDYLALVAAQHRDRLAERISYVDLPADPQPDPDPAEITSPIPPQTGQLPASHPELPGQLDLPDVLTDPAPELS